MKSPANVPGYGATPAQLGAQSQATAGRGLVAPTAPLEGVALQRQAQRPPMPMQAVPAQQAPRLAGMIRNQMV